MAEIFRWVHMSDVHFQDGKSSFNTSNLQDKLVDFLSTNVKDINALFLSGDFRYAKEKESNPQKVVEYTKQCAHALGLDNKKIYTMPGNHDLDRNEIRSIVAQKVRNEYNPDDGEIKTEIFHKLREDFSFYNEYHNQLDDATLWTDDNPHTVIDVGLFNLLILNTAIFACGDDDYHNMVIGTKFLYGCISKAKKNGKPIIAIGHHGLEWLKDSEKRACETYFSNEGVSLYLCGHAHDSWYSSFGSNGGHQVTVGCSWGEEQSAYAGFAVGEILEDGRVNIFTYKWDAKEQCWCEDIARRKTNITTLSLLKTKEKVEKVIKKEYKFSVVGYHLLGTAGEDGIKYVWEKAGKSVESIAFNQRLRIPLVNENNTETSAYCISTSFGCPLAVDENQCLFCGTGKRKFNGYLTAEEIALQCIFMAEYDSNCPSYPQVRKNKREFAFMGQGEPGFCYPSIREAILLTDYAMNNISQEVSRYIICTSGVLDFIPALIDDIRNKVYYHPVTVHFSLNIGGSERDELMPVNKQYDYHDFIKECSLLYENTQTKIGVSIMLFDQFCCGNNGIKYTLTEEKLNSILDELDTNVFKIDLCFVNKVDNIGQYPVSREDAEKMLKIVHSRGFEGKVFSSFGEGAKAACGMLDSNDGEVTEVGNQPIVHFNNAIDLLINAKACRRKALEKKTNKQFPKVSQINRVFSSPSFGQEMK